jgi:RNA polymerase sigma factor (sigma-70 family)
MIIPTIEKHYKDNRDTIVKKIAFRMGSPEAAEDVVQEAYYRALRYYDSYNEARPFNNWFSVILRNCVAEYKNIERGHPKQQEDDEDKEEAIAPQSLYSDYYNEIIELIQTKSAIQIEILNYFFINHYTVLDICAITDYNYKQIHQVVQRFRNELKEIYK